MAFNPKNYAGYSGNAKRITDAVTTSGSKVVTSPSGGFAGAVVGQTIWVSRKLSRTVIDVVTSATEVQVNINASASGTACECVFGGNDTGAFQLAFAAATASGRKTTMEVPNANCILTDRFYNYPSGSYAPNLVGEDDGTCTMFVSPDIPIPGDGSGVLIRSTGGSNRLASCLVWCPYGTYSMGTNQAIVQWDGNNVRLADIQIVNCFSTGASGFLRTFGGQVYSQNTNIYSFFDAPGSSPGSPGVDYTGKGWLQNGCGGVMINPHFSNLYAALDITNIVTRQGIGAVGIGMQIVSGFFDENGGPAANIVLHDNAALEMTGTLVWTSSVAGNYAVSVDPTSKLWMHQCGLGPWWINTSGARALKIEAGGVVRASQSTFWCTSNVSGISVQNDGVFNDCGGNDYKQAYPSFASVAPRNAIANLDTRFTNSFAGLAWRPAAVLPVDAE
jgi:hypothetical protein